MIQINNRVLLKFNIDHDIASLFVLIYFFIFALLTGYAQVNQLQERILLREDFYNNALNWPVGERSFTKFSISQGQYVFEHSRNELGWLVTNNLPITIPTDFNIEASINKVSGIGAGYGIIFSGSDVNNIHAFVISSNGYYRYSYYQNTKYIEVTGWKKSNYIVKGNAANILRVEIEGGFIKFYINNQYIDQAPYSTHFGKKLGFIIYKNQKVEIDYLQVSTPREIITTPREIISKNPIVKDMPLEENIASADENRIALVIGNSAYQTTPLRNPSNDAREITKVLQTLGFDVLSYIDATRSQMRRAIVEFGDKLAQTNGVGLFFYAGHGLQSDGVNYLVPVDAEITRAFEIEDECIRADRVLRMMSTYQNPLNIIILDACRNNPYSRSFRSLERGLAQPQAAATGSIVAFATAPGMTASDGDGNNGLYTQELIKAMQKEGLTIEEVFKEVRINVSRISGGKQIPWENSSLMGDFYFIKN